MINNKVVVGGMLVSRNPEILDITIPNMMKFCDWALVVLDNESEGVRQKILELQKKYYDRLFIRRSSFPNDILHKGSRILPYRQRWKQIAGFVRDDIFVNLRRIVELNDKRFKKPDILLLPDSDEIWTDYLPELLEKFINSDKIAILTKPIDVIGDMMTIRKESMFHHVHILKWREDYKAYPKRYRALYHPLKKGDWLWAEYYSVHLALLNDSIRGFRNEHWKSFDVSNEVLYKLPKHVEQMSPDEIRNIIK